MQCNRISPLQRFRWMREWKKETQPAKLFWVVFVRRDRRIGMRQKGRNFLIKIWNWFQLRLSFGFRASYVQIKVISFTKNDRVCLCIHLVPNASAAAAQLRRMTVFLTTAVPATPRLFDNDDLSLEQEPKSIFSVSILCECANQCEPAAHKAWTYWDQYFYWKSYG